MVISSIDKFEHYPTYDPQTGSCKSYLISLEDQVVQIPGGKAKVYTLPKMNIIYMEISQKFTLGETHQMASNAGFKPVHEFLDSKVWFVDAIWKVA